MTNNKLPTHAEGTARVGSDPTVPPAPVKDHSHDPEQIEANKEAEARERKRLDDITFENLSAALQGLADGKQPDQFVQVSMLRSVKIIDALTAAATLDGAFHAEHLDRVDSACVRVGVKRPSDKISEVVNVILRALHPKQRSGA